MKKLFLFFTLFIFTIVSAQTKYETLTITNYDSILKKLDSGNQNEIYNLNINDFKQLVSKSAKPFTLVYTYAWWCGPCRKKLPQVLEFKNKHQNKVELLILTGEKNPSKYLYMTNKEFNTKYNILFPTFNISDEISIKSKKKFHNFIQTIVPGHSDYGTGLSLNLLIDNKTSEVLYASLTEIETTDSIFSKLNSIISNN